MLLSTTDEIPCKKIVRYLGLVRGNTIRARHIGRDIMAGLRNIVGGDGVVVEGVTQVHGGWQK